MTQLLRLWLRMYRPSVHPPATVTQHKQLFATLKTFKYPSPLKHFLLGKVILHKHITGQGSFAYCQLLNVELSGLPWDQLHLGSHWFANSPVND